MSTIEQNLFGLLFLYKKYKSLMCKPYINHRNFFSYDDYQIMWEPEIRAIPKSKFILSYPTRTATEIVSKKLIKGDKSFYEYLNQCKKNGKRFYLCYL